MRRTGQVEGPGGLGSSAHVCWPYRTRAELAAAVRTFLGDGLARGERIAWIGPESADEVRERFSSAAGGDTIDRLLDEGRLELLEGGSTYAHAGPVDPERQVQVYADATDDALAAGYSGLRVAADVTELLRTATERDAFARYEHLVDRYMGDGAAFTALCAVNAEVLDAEAVVEVACMHPIVRDGGTPFQLFSDDGSPELVVLGEIDADTAPTFAGALGRTSWSGHAGAEGRRLDASGATYLDHRFLGVVDAHARSHGHDVTVVTHVGQFPEWLPDAVGVSRLRVEVQS